LLGIGLFGVIILHAGFAVQWSDAMGPVGALIGIQLVLYVSMYWVRKRFEYTHDPRPGIMIFGLYSWVLCLTALYYAGQLGLLNANVVASNYLNLSIFALIVTLIGVVLGSYWKRQYRGISETDDERHE